MINLDIREIHSKSAVDDRLKDINQVLSITVSLANGMVWKEKTKSFYEVIARELKAFFDDDLIQDLKLSKFRNKYLRVNIPNNFIIFSKNNLFEGSLELIPKENWLNQKLMFLEKCELPKYLTSNEKEKIYKNIDDSDREILNKSYGRQELNSNKFVLNLIDTDKEKLIDILNRNNYFSITVLEYIDLLATGNYNYRFVSDEYSMKIFKKTFNNYILELAAYISKVIENYLNER